MLPVENLPEALKLNKHDTITVHNVQANHRKATPSSQQNQRAALKYTYLTGILRPDRVKDEELVDVELWPGLAPKKSLFAGQKTPSTAREFLAVWVQLIMAAAKTRGQGKVQPFALSIGARVETFRLKAASSAGASWHDLQHDVFLDQVQGAELLLNVTLLSMLAEELAHKKVGVFSSGSSDSLQARMLEKGTLALRLLGPLGRAWYERPKAQSYRDAVFFVPKNAGECDASDLLEREAFGVKVRPGIAFVLSSSDDDDDIGNAGEDD